MVDKVKKYVQFELDLISQGFNAKLALERAYGAIMFVLYCGYNSELGEWWEKTLPRFEEAINKQKEKESRKDPQAWKKERSIV